MSSEEIEKNKCPKCDTPFLPTVKFCKNCGENIAAKLVSLQKEQERAARKNKLLNKWKRMRKSLLWTAIVLGSIIVLAIASLFVLDRQNEILIPVSNNGETWGFISSRTGEFIINPQFEDADFFSDGLARVRSRGRTGYISKRGDFVIPATFRSGTAFNDGLALVVSDGGHPTVINTNGEIQFVLYNMESVSAFSEGLAAFRCEEGKYGFVDTFGNIFIDAQFENAMPFSEGLARIQQDGRFGFIDRIGRVAITPQFEYARCFSDGLAAFWQDGMWGYINNNGRIVISPRFSEARFFSNRLAAVRNCELKWGFVDRSGEFEIRPQFHQAGNFFGSIPLLRSIAHVRGIAPAQINNRWGFVNNSGEFVINPQFMGVQLAAHQTNRFVVNDFYDTSEFVSLFFEREDGNVFDGVSASTTLAELSEHPVYGAGLNASGEHFAYFQGWIPITNDISIGSVAFEFGTPIFSWVNTYNNWGRVTDRRQQFDFTATPDVIMYNFFVSGRGASRIGAIVRALKDEIERRQGQPMSSRLEEHRGSVYYLLQEDGKLSFIIAVESASDHDLTTIWFFVIFNNEYMHRHFYRFR